MIVLTVPQHPDRARPVARDPRGPADAVLRLRAGQRREAVHAAASTSDERARARTSSTVFAPKGGVGKTTIAFNLAVALATQGHRTCLIDGSLQFGDLRSLLKVPADAPSILDLPTDRVQESDLADVLWRDPSGIDILLAPPRVELAEMVTVRDVDKIVSLLRRVYQVVVIDTPATLRDVTLAILDAATRSSRSSPMTRRPSATRSRSRMPSARSATRRQGALRRQPCRFRGRHPTR